MRYAVAEDFGSNVRAPPVGIQCRHHRLEAFPTIPVKTTGNKEPGQSEKNG